MKKVKNIIKSKIWLILVLLLVVVLIPSAFAFYYSGIDSNMTTNFKIEYDSVFVRAYIITYWEDYETGEIVAKSSWNLKDGVESSEWTKIDEYYYYNGAFTNTQIENNELRNHELIDQDLIVSDLTDENLTNAKYVAKYKIVYEILEAKAEGNKLSCEEAWGITYSSNWIPSKI